jgi:hypothetical protein
MVSDQDGCLVSIDVKSAEIGGSVWIWFAVFPSPAGMSLTKLSQDGNN